MSEETSTLSVKSIIHYPSEMEKNKTYLMTIDLVPEYGFVWQYEREEYPIYCNVYSETLNIEPIGEPVLVLHRFGGNYGSIKFKLSDRQRKIRAEIRIIFHNKHGRSIKSQDLPIRITSRKIDTISSNNENRDGKNNQPQKDGSKVVNPKSRTGERIDCLPEENRQEIVSISEIEVVPSNNEKRTVKHNLPQKAYSRFVNREDKLDELIDSLSKEDRQPIISIAGIGGVGKTTLALEVAYRYLECLESDTCEVEDVPRFENIIFISAKKTNLKPTGIHNIESEVKNNLGDICYAILSLLDEYGIMKANRLQQPKLVRERLEREGPTLIIIDNLETLEDRKEVIRFLVKLPINVKSVVTTRKQGDAIYVPIELDALSKDSSLELIQHRTAEIGISLQLEEQEELYYKSGGIPLVMIYAIGRLQLERSLKEVLDDLAAPGSDIAQFCFESLFSELDGRRVQRLLLTLSLFGQGATQDCLINVSGLQSEPFSLLQEDLDQLISISLVQRRKGRLVMLPPTREYILAKLHSQETLEREVRENWVNWYLQYTKGYGGDDWGNWVDDYDKIYAEWENLLGVLRWCASQKRDEIVWELWSSLNKVAYLYGLWTDRLVWLDYLINVSERNGKTGRLVEVLNSKAWTLIQKGSEEQLHEAKQLLDRAWILRDNAQPLKYMFANNSAVLNLRLGNLKEAERWLNQSDALINSTRMEDRDKKRSYARLKYYIAEMYYRSGDYVKAAEYFEEVQREAAQIDWLRFVSGSKEWLASIAIKNKRFGRAERLLNEGYPIALHNRDTRRLAFYQRGYARLRKEQQKYQKSLNWAEKSLETFERLNVAKRIEEMLDFIIELKQLIESQSN